MLYRVLFALALTAVVPVRAAPWGRLLNTGQKKCWDSGGTKVSCAGTGQDGELRKGLRPAYSNNGNGTITDKRTGLTWEKLSDDGSIHDKDNTYTWADAFQKSDSLNATAFAGFTDWRLPNQFELESIRDLGTVNPAVWPPFNTNCGANSSGNLGCTVTTCSCTIPGFYWSSSTYVAAPPDAWSVYFFDGFAGQDLKSFNHYVRAVRGGS